MKKCKECLIDKTLDQFYKHQSMADGHLNICKVCCRKQTKQKRIENMKDPDWVEKESIRQRAKGRKQYHERIKGTLFIKSKRKKFGKEYNARYPEKKHAKTTALKFVVCPPNFNRHHWSYKKENVLDVFIVSEKNHYLIHRYMKYVKKEMCYMTKGGTLLDTREKHEAFINTILQAESTEHVPLGRQNGQ